MMDWLRELRQLSTLRLIAGLAIVGSAVLLWTTGREVPQGLDVAVGAVVLLLFPSERR